MKTIATVILVCFGVLLCQGQNQLKLSVKAGSDAPNYETDHMYLLEVSNSGSMAANFTVSMKNAECQNVSTNDQTAFNQSVLTANKQDKLQTTVVQPGKTLEFYVKLSRPRDARLNTWNCTEIVAVNKEGKPISNPIIIESLIPNPNNNN